MNPNILVIYTDQWRGMDLGCAGNPDVKTPNIDRLAAQGIRYTHAFANAPLCTPSRAQFLTGRYPFALGMVTNDIAISPKETSIAHALNARGYRCGYIGKWHLDAWPRYRFTPPGPDRLGFDAYWAVHNCSHDYLHPQYYLDTPEMVQAEGYEPDHQTDLAMGFLDNHCANHGDTPFCLYLAWGPPHDPYPWVPERYRAMYDPESLTLRPNTKGTDRRALADYYAAMTALDENVGRLLEHLDRLGLRNNTVVVFTSDHGDMHRSHGNTQKQQPWDESINIPFIVRYPDQIAPGQVTDTLISVADMMPTILGLAGAPVPERCQGVDLSWSAVGGVGEEPDSVFLMEHFGFAQVMHNDIYTWRGVRTKCHLYCEDLAGPWLLYDMEQDPYQMRNLVELEEYADIRDALSAKLRSWYARLDEEYVGAVELAKRAGRWDEFEAVLEELYVMFGQDHPETIRFKQYFAEGGSWTNRRF